MNRVPRPPAPQRARTTGFTLIELMVVIVIIGVVVAGALLSIGTTGRDRELEQERDRMVALIDYVRERAAMQTVEYGLRCEQAGYRFVMYDNRKTQWLEDPLDDALRPRKLPAGLTLGLNVEDHEIVLPTAAAARDRSAPPDLTPQVMLFSSGDLTRFRLTLARPDAGRTTVISGTSAGKIDSGEIVELRR